MKNIQLIFLIIFYTAVATIISLSKPALDPQISAELTWNLITGTDAGFPIPGSELEPIRKLLPTHGAISFVSDKPFGVDIEMEKFYYDLQNYLCPLILSTKAGEKTGLAIFSTAESAQNRLTEINYSWVINWANSKGIIRKNA